MADIGSERIKQLVTDIKPKVDSIFDPKDYKVSLTGHSLVFLKSNDYLLDNLFESLLIEILLIALVGMILFRSVSIIVLSKIPCLIPLVITAGIMGFLGIRFKPSTILIFSIAFGISSDGTVYLLTKYRQELLKTNGNATLAISNAIKDTGLSMIYTSVILFFGFSIFSVSSFGGTAALGILISLTLLIFKYCIQFEKIKYSACVLASIASNWPRPPRTNSKFAGSSTACSLEMLGRFWSIPITLQFALLAKTASCPPPQPKSISVPCVAFTSAKILEKYPIDSAEFEMLSKLRNELIGLYCKNFGNSTRKCEVFHPISLACVI